MASKEADEAADDWRLAPQPFKLAWAISAVVSRLMLHVPMPAAPSVFLISIVMCCRSERVGCQNFGSTEVSRLP